MSQRVERDTEKKNKNKNGKEWWYLSVEIEGVEAEGGRDVLLLAVLGDELRQLCGEALCVLAARARRDAVHTILLQAL
jgi:hypothetical protein